MMRYIPLIGACLFSSSAPLVALESPGAFDLRGGDRVVFLSDGLVEQEQFSGWIELMLTTTFPDADVTFRNLEWSADTSAGDSRFAWPRFAENQL